MRGQENTPPQGRPDSGSARTVSTSTIDGYSSQYRVAHTVAELHVGGFSRYRRLIDTGSVAVQTTSRPVTGFMRLQMDETPATQRLGQADPLSESRSHSN